MASTKSDATSKNGTEEETLEQQAIPMVAAVLATDFVENASRTPATTGSVNTAPTVATVSTTNQHQERPLHHPLETPSYSQDPEDIPMIAAVSADSRNGPMAVSTQPIARAKTPHAHAPSGNIGSSSRTNATIAHRPLVTVVAPAKLPEGYSFTAQLQGSDFRVVVPAGGVDEGQHFDVPIQSSGRNASSSQGGLVIEFPPVDPVTGHWRKSCISCCQVFSDGLFWQAICLTPILLAQLAQRLRLNVVGKKKKTDGDSAEGDDADNTTTCQTISVVFAIYYGLMLIAVGAIFWPLAFGFMVLLATNIRLQYRQHYKIQTTCSPVCPSPMEDFCCALCCTACVGIQMARHTHDEEEYPYQCCTETGLPLHAPLPPA